ncbi:alpha/beta hydrolase family protein [Sphingobium sp.]|uniref:alpha/beta hydrolase family protein n=1 Tax=Sphingobium sp. TaxID=1912891 RepID=UPI003BB7A59F
MTEKKGTSYTRTPYLTVYREPAGGGRKDVYGSLGEHVAVQSQLMRGDTEADTVIITTHPIGSQAYLPVFSGLAGAGHHVIAAANRYINGDFALQAENLLLDLGAVVRDAKERLGYKKVVLAGWSGGGSIISGYQAEAEDKRITTNAAGEYNALADTELMPADGVMLLAPHRSRHHLITDFIDPAITDELDPSQRDAALDLYPESGPRTLPLDREWVATYRAAQLARNRRITQWAKNELAELARRGDAAGERAFIVHGTMADPRWVDISLDPNQRKPGSYIGDPKTANNGLAALARFTSLRSWLSQWGFDTAQIDAVDAAGRISKPILVVVNDADDACPTTHTDAIFAAIKHDKKTMMHVSGANHYYAGSDQKPMLKEAVALVTDWIQANI